MFQFWQSISNNNMEKKRILITGASGIIGENIARMMMSELRAKLFLLSRTADDFTKFADVENISCDPTDLTVLKKIIIDIKPEIIINAAGMSDVKKCEADKKLCSKLNNQLVEQLISSARVCDSHLITFSSVHVFDGVKGNYTEESKQNPLNYFGKSKLGAENTCIINLKKSTIVRVPEVFGFSSFNKEDIVTKYKRQLENKENVNAKSYFFSNPLLADDLAWMVTKLITLEKYGIYHAGGKTVLNNYDLAMLTAQVFDLDKSLVLNMTDKGSGQKIRIPEKGTLEILKATTELKINFAFIQNSLTTLKYHYTHKPVNSLG
jgi:dTDP-4-dehydrorhamnose reductase